MRTIIKIALVAALLVLGGCAKKGPYATVLSFQESELGGSLFPTQVMITKQYVRIDSDTGTGNYILFNRKARVIYSVDAVDHTILVIHAHPVTLTPPMALVNVVKKESDAPDFHGHKVVHYVLFTNGEQCYSVYASRGLLRHATRALSAYEKALAGEQAVTAENAPPGVETPCDLADNVFDPGREYAQGFPVRVTDEDKNQKILTKVQHDVSVSPQLFTLPRSYVLYSPGEVRSGG